uniref:Uncharacterized protein n=1 Tax=Zea mays TaxID=4577 RepID=C0PBB8_MAIZE|nr:unknown [Zea mays]
MYTYNTLVATLYWSIIVTDVHSTERPLRGQRSMGA